MCAGVFYPRQTFTRRQFTSLAVASKLVTVTWRSSIAQESCSEQLEQAATVTHRVATRDELLQAARAAKPGSQILLEPGVYRGGIELAGLRGSADQPIVIGAVDRARPPVIEGGSAGLHLRAPRDVELRDLVITGATANGVNIDDGGDIHTPAERVTLRNVEVRDVGPRGNRDGFKLSGTRQFLIVDCRIRRWGDSGSAIDLVGCHEGEIRNCTFADRGDTQGNGVQIKGGSAKVAVRNCRFDQAGGRAINLGGSTGADYFRPRGAPFEARELVVEDCVIIGSQAAVAFVNSERCAVRYNTIYQPQRWVARVLQESRGEPFLPCRDSVFSHNLVVYRAADLRTAVNVGDATEPRSFTFTANHWYCSDQPERGSRPAMPVAEQEGVYGVRPRFVNEDQLDLRLASDSPVRGVGARNPAPPPE